MTTIIYDHKNKQIACDSRATAGSTIVSDSVIKFHERAGYIWFMCGCSGSVETFITKFEALKDCAPNIDTSGLFVFGKLAYSATIDDDIFREDLLEYSFSVGSGSEYALAALDHGKTAKEAVEYAMTRDIYTGGKVNVYDIEKGEFI